MFVNLHGHTENSHLDAIIKIDDLFDRAKELGMPAVAITDHGVMAGNLKAFDAYKRTGVKYIPGNEIYFTEDISDKRSKRGHLILLASNEVGYKNLLRLTAESFKNPAMIMGKVFPRVNADMLRRYSEGIYCTSACMSSLIADGIFRDETEHAEGLALLLKSIFKDRFFIELQPHDLKFVKKDKKTGEVYKYSQKVLNNSLIKIANKYNIEMVATCDSHYLTPDHEPYHDMIQAISSKAPLDDLSRKRYASRDACLVCSGYGFYPRESKNKCTECAGTGQGSPKPCTEYYLKSEDDILKFFSEHYSEEFARELTRNTAKIAEACEAPDYIEPRGHRLPEFGMDHIKECNDYEDFKEWLNKKPERLEMAPPVSYIKYRSWKGFLSYCKNMPHEEKKRYWDRLVHEISILEDQGFCSYMLIVADYMNWARKNDVYVGPSRGSGGSSLVGFFLGIHELDSIKYNLLFERFISRLRKELPDYDCDFAPSTHSLVYDYIAKKYGEEHVSYISNISYITPKVAIKDIARSLQIGGDKSTAFKISNGITSSIPDTIERSDGKTIEVKDIDTALEHSAPLRKFAREYPEVIEYARHITGLPRSFSTHAGGVIISDVPLTEYAPLRRDKDGAVATQYDKYGCEQAGLVKMDLLRIEILDTMRETYEMAHKIGIKLPKYNEVPYNDRATYDLIASGKVIGLFQLDGSTLAPLCGPMKPRSIEDLAMINAIGRPAVSKEERREFINRRFGKEKIVYPHPMLRGILKHTYGISVYDEDLLRIAQHVAGWDLAEADKLRKLTKLKAKGADLAVQLEEKFIKDAGTHSKLSKQDAKRMWDEVIVPFSGYAFCLAHAIGYGLLGYRTAFYKRHATAPFLCAYLNSKTRSNSQSRDEAIEKVKREIRSFGISIAPIDINLSAEYYTTSNKKTIVTGFGAIRGLGAKALKAIVENQKYSSFEDFIYRTPSSSVNKTAIQALAKSGAFDSLGVSRKFVHDHYATIRKEVAAYVKKLPDSSFEGEDRSKPYSDYLDNFASSVEDLKKEEWSIKQKMFGEKEVLGEYLSGSAENLFPGFFKGGMWKQTLSEINTMPKNSPVPMEGVIVNYRELMIKRGKSAGSSFGKATMENLTGEAIEVTIWSDQWQKLKPVFDQGDTPIRGMFRVDEWEGKKGLVLNKVESVLRRKSS